MIFHIGMSDGNAQSISLRVDAWVPSPRVATVSGREGVWLRWKLPNVWACEEWRLLNFNFMLNDCSEISKAKRLWGILLFLNVEENGMNMQEMTASQTNSTWLVPSQIGFLSSFSSAA